MADQIYWKKALERSEQALRQQALVPLSTSRVEIHGPNADQFELRELNDRLPKHHRSEGPKINPFRPWDPELAIDNVGNDHVLILNKYPVQTGHMLLITREWASQVDWLTLKDWRALVSVDNDSTGLWFLNSGPLAGASQPHRHLQLLPRESDARSCPRVEWFERLLEARSSRRERMNDPLTRSCMIARRPRPVDSVDEARELHTLYRHLANALRLGNKESCEPHRRPTTFC